MSHEWRDDGKLEYAAMAYMSRLQARCSHTKDEWCGRRRSGCVVGAFAMWSGLSFPAWSERAAALAFSLLLAARERSTKEIYTKSIAGW